MGGFSQCASPNNGREENTNMKDLTKYNKLSKSKHCSVPSISLVEYYHYHTHQMIPLLVLENYQNCT